ncbi:hypothetical protein KX816_14930 [Sphingosinicellaceae bacterium]|nr:hypothetical protein KX816_14930 [Sphingosinicellaceae bacterium]
MAYQHSTRAVRVLRVYCPIAAETLVALATGQAAAIDRDATLAAILGIVRGDNPLGDFAPYRSVVELAPGWELFTPGADARPALGEAGRASASPTAILTIYIPADAPEAAVSSAVDAIVAAHPWEVPVIELTEARLVVRS